MAIDTSRDVLAWLADLCGGMVVLLIFMPTSTSNKMISGKAKFIDAAGTEAEIVQ